VVVQIAGMEPGSYGKIVEAFREFFKEKMHHFPEEIEGIWYDPWFV
jgi:hypothetical protein